LGDVEIIVKEPEANIRVTERGSACEIAEVAMARVSKVVHALMRWFDDKFGDDHDPY
jgi:hypothetical protein